MMPYQNIFLLCCCMLILSGCSSKTSDSVIQSSQSHNRNDKAYITKKDVSSSIETETSITEPSSAFHSDRFDYWLEAVTNQDLNQINKLIKEQVQGINEKDSAGNTALMVATQNNDIHIAKALIDAQADVNIQNKIQDSPFLYAGAEGRNEILEHMLKYSNINFSLTNRFGGNALIPAAEKGHIKNVHLLLEDGRSNINFQNNYGYTALIEAVGLNDGSQIYQEISQLLVDYGADVSIRDFYGMTALDYATDKKLDRIISILKTSE